MHSHMDAVAETGPRPAAWGYTLYMWHFMTFYEGGPVPAWMGTISIIIRLLVGFNNICYLSIIYLIRCGENRLVSVRECYYADYKKKMCISWNEIVLYYFSFVNSILLFLKPVATHGPSVKNFLLIMQFIFFHRTWQSSK